MQVPIGPAGTKARLLPSSDGVAISSSSAMAGQKAQGVGLITLACRAARLFFLNQKGCIFETVHRCMLLALFFCPRPKKRLGTRLQVIESVRDRRYSSCRPHSSRHQLPPKTEFVCWQSPAGCPGAPSQVFQEALGCVRAAGSNQRRHTCCSGRWGCGPPMCFGLNGHLQTTSPWRSG